MVTTLGYCRKKSEQGVVTDTLFLKKPLEILDLSLYPWEFQRKQTFNSQNFAKLCETPLGLDIPKTYLSVIQGQFPPA